MTKRFLQSDDDSRRSSIEIVRHTGHFIDFQCGFLATAISFRRRSVCSKSCRRGRKRLEIRVIPAWKV